jgi:hypothetical protein
MAEATGLKVYCGVVIDTEQGSEDPGTTTAPSATISNIRAQWARNAELWDDGVNKYIFWGDTEGEVTIFNLELELGSCDPDPEAAVAEYSDALSLGIYQGRITSGSIPRVMLFTGCYDWNLQNKQLKQIGDKLVIEGGTNFKIFIPID